MHVEDDRYSRAEHRTDNMVSHNELLCMYATAASAIDMVSKALHSNSLYRDGVSMPCHELPSP